jgi:hypothetical protein
MEPPGPVVSSVQVSDSLNPPIQNLTVPGNLDTSTEEKAVAIAHKGETKMPDPGRCLTFFLSQLH